jgi:HK97 family phage prohead protease
VSERGKTFTESVNPKSFDNTLMGDGEIKAYAFHDPNQLLGKRSTGTLRLRVAEDGLYGEIDLPETSVGNDILALQKRGELECSFGFLTKADKWNGSKRELMDVDLQEVSIVVTGANPQAKILGVRSDIADTDDNLQNYKNKLRLREHI